MKINSALDKFLSSTELSTSIFIGSGVYKTCVDYKMADKKYKDKFLVKDCVVLSGAALGLLAHQSVSGKVPKIMLKNKVMQEMAREFCAGFTLFTAGILGALSADFLLEKSGFETPEIEQKEAEKNRIEKYVNNQLDKISDEKTRKIVYSRATDMPQVSVLTPGMIGSYAIDLSKEKELKLRLQNTTRCLINNSLLPLLFLTTSSVLTKGMKALYRLPLVFGSLVGGTMLVNKITEKQIINLSKLQ